MSGNYTSETIRDIQFTRVDNDFYGNPRYVVHFLTLADTYNQAREVAHKLGGKAYRAKWYGGGFVFQSYNLPDLAKQIIEEMEKDE